MSGGFALPISQWCSENQIPLVFPGQKIGLFGGSFNPPHRGHLHLAQTARKLLGLGNVWWLVTPQNPLKANRPPPPPLIQRMAQAQLSRPLQDLPGMQITGCEARLGVATTAHVVKQIKARCPGVHFVWLMGADNLSDFHRWSEWKSIFMQIPICVVDRPGSSFAPLFAKAAQAFKKARRPLQQAHLLPLCPPPAWIFLFGSRNSSSATEIRKEKTCL